MNTCMRYNIPYIWMNIIKSANLGRILLTHTMYTCMYMYICVYNIPYTQINIIQSVKLKRNSLTSAMHICRCM